MQTEEIKCDVLIAGCGVSGLYAALNLPLRQTSSWLRRQLWKNAIPCSPKAVYACFTMRGDYDAFYEDTMRAGHYENRAESVDIMIRSSRSVIDDLIRRGVDFEREADGSLAYTREGPIHVPAFAITETLRAKRDYHHVAGKRSPSSQCAYSGAHRGYRYYRSTAGESLRRCRVRRSPWW